MIVLDIDAAYKAVEILHESPGFCVRPTANGFVARADGYSGFGDNALVATLRLFRSMYPHLALNFFVETNQRDWQ